MAGMNTSQQTPVRTAGHTRGPTPEAVSASTHRLSPSGDNPDLRPLVKFVAAALPFGWVLLSIPLFTDAPLAPFILGTLYFGLVLPTVVLTRRDREASMRQLLRDTLRPPRPLWLLLPAATVIPVATYAVGTLLDRNVALSSG